MTWIFLNQIQKLEKKIGIQDCQQTDAGLTALCYYRLTRIITFQLLSHHGSWFWQRQVWYNFYLSLLANYYVAIIELFVVGGNFLGWECYCWLGCSHKERGILPSYAIEWNWTIFYTDFYRQASVLLNSLHLVHYFFVTKIMGMNQLGDYVLSSARSRSYLKRVRRDNKQIRADDCLL